MYLLSNIPCTLITDHDALLYAFQKKFIHVRLARWMKFLAIYDFEIKHRKSRANLVFDFLSRMEGKENQVEEGDEGGLVNLIEFTSDEYDVQVAQVDQFLRNGRIDWGCQQEVEDASQGVESRDLERPVDSKRMTEFRSCGSKGPSGGRDEVYE